MNQKSARIATIPVNWGDMDALGHGNNAVVIKYIEVARISYLESILSPTKAWRSETVGPILLKISCRYLQPIVYPDTLTIHTQTEKIGNTSITMSHSIKSEKLGLVAEGESIIVMFDYQTQEKVSVPQKVKDAIEKLQS